MKASTLSQTLRAEGPPSGVWSILVEALTRPYRVPASLVLLVSLVPLYVFIPSFLSGRTYHAPAVALDRLFPLKPIWAVVYGALYLFLIVLPVLVVREDEHIRRTVRAYLLVWIAAYVCFFAYPTVAPRPETVSGQGFGVWGLRFLYGADPPYNCFPSLHVAHSFVSALACFRLHRRVGAAAVVAASLVGISTLYTKQHYVLDVAAGALLAYVAYLAFLRGYSPGESAARGRRAAPVLAVSLFGALAIVTSCVWLVYRGLSFG